MPDATIKSLDEFDAAFGGGMLRVRAGLGVTSFGMQVIRLPAGYEGYPDHDHTHDKQEEVYTALQGSFKIKLGDEEHVIEPGTFVRVGPGQKRHISTEEGAQILAMGGIPGEVYVPPDWSEEGARAPSKHG